MNKVVVIGDSGKSRLIALVVAELGREALVVRPRDYQGCVWATLAMDECVPPSLYPKQTKARKGKGQRKANRANRWQ